MQVWWQPSPKVTHCLAASLSIEESIKRRDSQATSCSSYRDVISVAWLLRCCAARQLLPVRPSEWLAVSPATRCSTEGLTWHADRWARLSNHYITIALLFACAWVHKDVCPTHASCSVRRSSVCVCRRLPQTSAFPARECSAAQHTFTYTS